MIRIFLISLLLTLPCFLSAQDLVFAEGSEWEIVSDDHQFAEGMAWDSNGHFLFTDVPRNQLFRVDKNTGEKTLIDGETGRANGIAVGPDGRLYGCASGNNAINAWDLKTGKKTAVNSGTPSNDIAILKNGTIFYTDPNSKLVWRLAAGSFERNQAATLPWKPNGIALSLDQKTLLVAEFDSDTIHGFPIGEDSRLTGTSFPAYRLGMPSDKLGRLDGMVVLPDGRLLSGTNLGTQIASPVYAGSGAAPLIIIPSPEGRPRCNYVRISPDNQWMYTAYAKDVLRRKLKPGFGQP
ncbi:MAG: SMP-30/gluconolactonase/LRE family protein [Verrucomicrobia bacterium]|nr:SMP-30/gluconolactonase/LRE family protein [Verrucomicrobiota bacterium]MDA1065919.1 SMP-30/gluconolactonase/LRE family protein [Verrucomicrobiota bacterium]